MFAKFARFISRHWIWVLVTWVVLAICLKLVAPKWEQITHDGDFAYLPASMTSVRGEKLMDEAFPELTAKSSVVLVVARDGSRLTGDDKEVVTKLAEMFTPKEGEKSPVLSVLAYRDDDVVGKKLISTYDPKNPQKGQAALVVLQLANEFMAVDNMAFIRNVYAKVAAVQKEPGLPVGLQLGVTGSAPVGSDVLDSMRESIQNTELATIVLVVVILLLVYRAPGLLVVPLASIAVSYFVAIDVIALVAQWCEAHHWDFQVFTTTNIFIVVILFGAATDYCLFLIARYREELEHGIEPRVALEVALGQTGHALTASAMTTILGLGAMVFADFGKYRSGGPTIAMSLVVALAACMTIAPALLRAMGRAVLWEIPLGWLFAWPARLWRRGSAQPSRAAGNAPTLMNRFWIMISRQIVSHPGLILVGSFLVLALPAWHGFNVPITYDMLAELDVKRESVQGMKLLEKHFLIGETGPLVVLAHRPGGDFDAAAERTQITKLAMALNDFVFTDSHGQKIQPIDHVRCLTNPLGDPLNKKASLAAVSRRITASNTPESKRQFLSSGEYQGEVTRFELITNFDPFSQESMDLLSSIDKWLKDVKDKPDSAWHDVGFDFTGITAQIRDLDAVNRSDTLWVGVYVALAVMIVLMFLIRRPLISLYLIFTVVFGYLVSLGMTHLFFSWLYGSTFQGLDWKLKIFLFVILVAVGEDYNIYLVTRVFEEQRRRGPLEGLREAVVRTGGIITSCGVIMAGTFGSMATGTLRSMVELGFAMSLGVLLDTFIIRTILVPAFLALLARWGVRSAVEARGDLAAPHYESVAGELVRSSK